MTYTGRVHSLGDSNTYEGLKKLRRDTPPNVLRAARAKVRRERIVTASLAVVGVLIVIGWLVVTR